MSPTRCEGEDITRADGRCAEDAEGDILGEAFCQNHLAEEINEYEQEYAGSRRDALLKGDRF